MMIGMELWADRARFMNETPEFEVPPPVEPPMNGPKLVERVEPPPSEFEGPVVVQIAVETSGQISAARLIRGSEADFAMARHALARWRFVPARIHGQPVRVRVTITVSKPQPDSPRQPTPATPNPSRVR
jgi:TonB family protein